MGWGRMFLLGDLGQQLDIDDLEESLATLESQVEYDRGELDETANRLRQLEREVAELRLYLATALRLLQYKRIVSPAEMQAMVEAVDRIDGRRDGQHRGPITG